MENTTRQDKRDSKKKQSSYSVYSSKHIRIAAELAEKRQLNSSKKPVKTKK